MTAVFPGGYGKPRPAVVIQSSRLTELESILLCPLTSDTNTGGPARVHITASSDNNLRADPLIMVDKIVSVSLSRCRERIGALSRDELDQVNQVLAIVVGLTD